MRKTEALAKREGNYDLLRIVCTIAVITIHVSASYKNAFLSGNLTGARPNDIPAIFLYNTLSRFAVPCFMMLSGAFVLSDSRNGDYRCFYRKSFRNIGVPTLIFSVLYLLYSLAVAAGKYFVQGADPGEEMLTALRDFVCGKPFYHMWYLYMLAGVYLLAPAAVRLVREAEERIFAGAAWAFLIVACLGGWTSEHTLMWDMGYSFCYMGYFFIGYVIRKRAAERKNSAAGAACVTAGLAILAADAWAEYANVTAAPSQRLVKFSLVDPFAPAVVLASVLIFAGFSLMRIRRDFGRLSEATFFIYLLHAGVWSLISYAERSVLGQDKDCRVLIPLFVAAVFVLSAIAARLCGRLWNRFGGRTAERRKGWPTGGMDGRRENEVTGTVGLGE